jgi:hypothetical protein
MTGTISAQLTNKQILVVGIYAGRLSSCFVKAFFHHVVKTLAGNVIPSDSAVVQACEHALAVEPGQKSTKARKAEQRKLKRILSRSNLPPSMAEEQTSRARRPKIERPKKREENSHMR